MRLQKLYYVILLINFAAFPMRSLAQSLPVGTPVLEDALRRAQLLGQIDSSISFTSRPLFPAASMKLNNVFDPYNTLENERWTKSDGIFRFAKERGIIQLLPFTWLQQFNTHHPYSLNDGAMIPARGYQTMISGGLYAKYGPLSIQLRPEYVYAANRNFQGFYKEQSDQVWAEFYLLNNIIDLPEKFGESAYKKLFWGQSSLRLSFGAVSLGISNENLWWGPGVRNSLIMSNSAPGFKHITLNTVKPIRTWIGSFEGQIICGRLEDSGFTPPDTNRTYNGFKLYVPKRTDWRYLNGMVISYQPKWIPGLFLGATRTFITYYKDMGRTFKDFLPIVTPMTKEANYGEKESPFPNDQRASFFLRWLWLRANAEIYTEYMREDHALNFRQIITFIEHTHAFVFGFRKLIPLKTDKNQYLQVNLELTKIEQTTTNPEAPSKYLYVHYAGISQGYTNRGQMLGAGIGPGSNMQSLSISMVQGLKTIGIEFERIVQNNDFHNAVIRDPRAIWVDLGLSTFGEWNYKNLLFSAKMEFIKSLNYQNYYHSKPNDPSQFWSPSVFNFQTQIGVSYRF
jgi:hypothetical protein